MTAFLSVMAYLFVAGVVYASVVKVFVIPGTYAKAALVAASLLWGIAVPLAMVAACVWTVYRVAGIAVDKASGLLEKKDDNDGS